MTDPNDNVAYECKFCRKPGVITLEGEFSNRIKKLLSLACCNRCGDFFVAKRNMEDRIKEIALSLYTARLTKTAQLQDIVGLAREKLNKLTHAYAELVCRYWRITTVWEPDFIEQIFDHPRMSLQICGQYFKMAGQLVKQKQTS